MRRRAGWRAAGSRLALQAGGVVVAGARHQGGGVGVVGELAKKVSSLVRKFAAGGGCSSAGGGAGITGHAGISTRPTACSLVDEHPAIAQASGISSISFR